MRSDACQGRASMGFDLVQEQGAYLYLVLLHRGAQTSVISSESLFPVETPVLRTDDEPDVRCHSPYTVRVDMYILPVGTYGLAVFVSLQWLAHVVCCFTIGVVIVHDTEDRVPIPRVSSSDLQKPFFS